MEPVIVMVKLVCKENPSIFIVAPDELVSEVGGNCWQVGGPQPITYPKHLWEKMEYVSLPSNLDEAAKKAYKEYDVKTAVKPKEHPVGFLFFDGFKAGAEWIAGQFFPRWRNINEDKPKQGEGCACIIVTVNGRIKYSNFEDGPWFWSEKIDDELLGETEAFIGYNFYGDKEYHTCSHWMPWDEFIGVLERQFKK